MTAVSTYICHPQTNAKHRNLLEEICNCIDPVGNIILIFLVGGVGRTFGIYLAPNSQLKYFFFQLEESLIVTCHGSNPTKSLGKSNFRLTLDQLEIAANVLFQLRQTKVFSHLFVVLVWEVKQNG